MRILLTGTGGQIGGALLPLLESHGTLLTPSRAEFDLSKPETLAAKLDELKPDLIVNPAAYTAVDRAEDEPDLAFLINAKAPAEIARWAARANAPLLHFSTDYVYDGSGTTAWREDSVTGPLSIYGASKLAGDRAIADANPPHLVFRTSWVYAAKGTNFLRTIARLAGERKELRIISDQIGTPTSASAIAGAVVKILTHETSNPTSLLSGRSGVVNLVCAGQASWYEFAVAIVEGLRLRGIQLPVEHIAAITTAQFPTKAKRPANSRLDLSRLGDLFGITMPDWRDALERELDEYVRGASE